MKLIILVALLCVGAAASERQLQSVTTSNQTENYSIAFVPAGGKGSAPLPLDDPRVAVTGGPEQVHLTYVNSTAVVVSWTTGNGTIVNGPVNLGSVSNVYGPYSTQNVSAGTAFPVLYGTTTGSYTMNATGNLVTYAQIYTGFNNGTAPNSNPTLNYTSPMIHHVSLANLKPNTTYFYQVSSGNGSTSAEFNFTTPPALGSFPMTMGVFADVGQTYNSSTTIDRMVAQNPEILVLVGDFTYSDDYLTNGTTDYIGFPNNTFSSAIPSPSGSYQPRWDSWFQLAQPLLSHIPLIPNSGNHELEPQGDGRYFETAPWGLDNGRQFNSYLSRLPIQTIYPQSGGAPLYWSVEVGPVHMITLNNYENFLVNGSQFAWFQQNVAKINRTRTPWVVATWHAPWYSSYTTHYKETESMRVTFEPLFYAAGVDLVLNGHLHEYERSNALYNYQVNNCGTVHITMGDGGNIEGLYTTFVDQNGTTDCPTPGPKSLPNYQPGPWTPSFTYPGGINNGYCPNSQPAWSAFREPAFGHGVLTFINETTASWQWNRNLDAGTQYLDTVYIIRDRTCFNYAGNGPTLAPLLAPTAALLLNQTQSPTTAQAVASLG